MKTKALLFATLGCIALITFFSCKKNSNNTTNPQNAYLMAYNLAPDQSSVNFTVAGTSITNPSLSFPQYTSGYATVSVGSHDVASLNASTGAQLATNSQTFEDSGYYSVFLVGINNNYRNVFVKDNLDSVSIDSSMAYVRYINAIADTTLSNDSIMITSGSSNIVDTAAAFATVSSYKGITPGSITVNVSGSDTLNKTFTVSAGNIYSLLLTGQHSSGDSATSVQAILVPNGQIHH